MEEESGIMITCSLTGRDAALENKLEAVTAVQAAAALRKYIEPSKLTVVTAGSFATAPVAK